MGPVSYTHLDVYKRQLFHNHPDEFFANNPEGWELLTSKVEAVLKNNGDGYEAIVPMKYEDRCV